ncbi:LysR family transcriptional regulator [Roseibium sediminis]|uniref:LysR family transcriptional regulator n=1 Tax=Roseibium sediminis TaxID=1775174 RepID=UPI00123E37F0|nr:LysR family transcriptional regulator [Roseibium sediminis]
MNFGTLPPLTSLKAFAAVAETGSLSAAGRMLNVTHVAVSQQVRSLEDHLGHSLVVREGRGVVLTEEGRLLAQGVRQAFVQLQDTVEALSKTAAGRPLHITMTPAFAVSWLMPRISEFRREHPELELMLNPTAAVVEMQPGGVDVAIRFGNGKWRGLDAEMLLSTNFVVVAATCLVGDKEFHGPEDLLGYPWLQEFGTNELSQWVEWQGVVPRNKLNVTHLPGYMVLEGLRRGEGITATARTFIEAEIEAGTLKVLFEEGASETTGYHIVTRQGVQRPAVKAFVSWLRNQVRSVETANGPR